MKRATSYRGIAAALAAALFASSAALAQAPAAPPAPPASHILVVDIQLVMRESKAGKSVQEQIKQQQSVYQKEVASQENEFRSANEELKRQQSILAPDALQGRMKELEQKWADLQRIFNNRRATLEKGAGLAENQVLDAMVAIVGDIGKERGASLVLPRTQVVWGDRRLDITDETMKRLDQKLPAVAVNFNVPAQAAPSAAAPAGGTQAASKAKPKPKGKAEADKN
jgi:Skp family chaperone for outer membrane proteins